MEFRKSWLIITAVLLAVGFTGIATSYQATYSTVDDSPPGETACDRNPDSQACQNPTYTDNQAKYIYDLDASWIFSGLSAPTDSGPSIFYGAAAGGEFMDNVSFANDTGSSNTVTEQYIEGTGPEDSNNWGRGDLKGISLTVPGSTTGSGPHGQYLITPPHAGQCGDGIPNAGDETTCPEDWGTPQTVTLSSEPSPSRTIWYDETGSTSETFGPAEEADDIHIDGNTNDETDYHTEGSYTGPYAENTYIYRDTVSQSTDTIDSGTHYYYGSAFVRDFSSEGDFDIVTGSDATDSQTVCTSRGDSPRFYRTRPTMEQTTETVSEPAETYNAVDQYIAGTASAQITYNDGYSTSDPVQQCDGQRTVYTSCSGDPQTADCDNETITRYTGTEQPNWQVFDSTWRVTYDDFHIQRSSVWGPVNGEPGMFNRYFGMNVYDSSFGYHSTRNNDNRQGSNDQSVSANRYELHEGANFYAERIASHVANADGPDGGGDGLIAYNENTGVEGVSNGVFGSELWDGSSTDYISASDLPSIDCPGDALQCVASLDVSTKQSGWGSNPEDSFSIDID